MEFLLLITQATQQPTRPPARVLSHTQITQSYCSNYGGRPRKNPQGTFTHCELTEEQYRQVRKDYNNKRFVLGRYNGA